jgi:hypothetical protein
MTPHPDIEIYIKRPSVEVVLDWLRERFQLGEVRKKGETLECHLQPNDLIVIIVPGAVKGGFTSVWFKHGLTPWATDVDCAREAFARFHLEVRCSTGPWQEDEEHVEEGGWLRLTSAGEQVVNWF